MLKKMRWRFIGAAMAAFLAVLTVLIAGINFWNYSITTERADHFLERISKEEPVMGHGRPLEDDKPPESKELMRYFVVGLDTDGTVADIRTEFDAQVTQQEADAYAQEVYENGHTKGFLDVYRYLVQSEDGSIRIVFLNMAGELRFIRTLFLISILVGFVSLMIVFALVYLFSGRAMKPYIKNIELQKRFITDASHELKTPLTSISASADILALDDPDNEWICNIRKQTVKLSKLIGGLITLSRLDEEKPFPKYSDFSFSDVVWETIEPFTSVARAMGKSFTYQIGDGLRMKGDQETIREMISILLDNAMKYSDANGSVRLDARRWHGKIVLQVWNTCTAVSVKEADRLFERFYRPDQSRSEATGGTGIGLSIAKAAVESHRGKISVSCKEKESICFKVVF